MQEERSPRQVVELYLDALDRQDWDALGQLVAAGYAHHSNGTDFTFEQFRARTEWLVGGIRGLTLETVTVVADGPDVAVRWIARGAHHGSLNGERPTGRDVAFPGITMFRVADGLVVEDWQAFDERHLYTQLSPFVGFG